MPAVAMPALPSEQSFIESGSTAFEIREPLPFRRQLPPHVSLNVRMAANLSSWISETVSSSNLAASPGCGVSIHVSFL